MEKYKGKTQKIRLAIALKTLKFFTPQIHRNYNVIFQKIHNSPRPFTEYLKSQNLKNLVGAEIGFGYGDNAKNLLAELPIKKLFCIDKYINKKYVQNKREITNYQNHSTVNNYLDLKNDKRVTFIEYDSLEAVKYVPDEIDFVYIDGNHTYKYVYNELKLYSKKVREGGFIGGHDYIFGQNGVIEAVHNFILDSKLIPQICFPDFIFTKKEKK